MEKRIRIARKVGDSLVILSSRRACIWPQQREAMLFPPWITCGLQSEAA